MFNTKNYSLRSLARRSELAKKSGLIKKRGYSMIEIAIGTVIVGLLLAVTISYVRGILADNRSNAELQELPMVVSKITKMYNNRPTFNGISTAILAANGVYPAERVNGAVITNRFGGAVTVAAATTSIADDSVTLTYTLVGESECKAIIPQLDNSMTSMSVNSTAVKVAGSPVNLTTLGAQCANATNTIAYTFKK